VTYCLRSVGLLLVNTPINIWAITKLPDSILNHGNTVQSTLRQVVSTLGIAIMVSVMSLVTAFSGSQLTGISVAYWLSVGIAVVCFILVIAKVRSEKTGNKALLKSEEITNYELDIAMKKTPYALSTKDTIASAALKLIEFQTSSLPIVDTKNHIVGYISDGDVLRYLSKKDVRFFTDDYSAVLPDFENFAEKANQPHHINYQPL
jgi:uncharacterized membrane protein